MLFCCWWVPYALTHCCVQLLPSQPFFFLFFILLSYISMNFNPFVIFLPSIAYQLSCFPYSAFSLTLCCEAHWLKLLFSNTIPNIVTLRLYNCLYGFNFSFIVLIFILLLTPKFFIPSLLSTSILLICYFTFFPLHSCTKFFY